MLRFMRQKRRRWSLNLLLTTPPQQQRGSRHLLPSRLRLSLLLWLRLSLLLWLRLSLLLGLTLPLHGLTAPPTCQH